MATNFEQLDFAEEATTDGDERLLRPFVEPIDAGRVCHGGKFATAHPKCASDWREAEYHLHTRTTPFTKP